MPIWVIEFFGGRDLDRAFWIIALMTAPVWIAMIVFPTAKPVRALAQPFVLPPLFGGVLIVLLWKSYAGALLPEPMSAVSYSAGKDLARHPVAFLAFFCNLQILNLAVGTVIFQRALRAGFKAPVELLLAWFLGALALIPFAIHLLIRRRSLS